MEDKQKILNHLSDALNLCRIVGDMEIDMEYIDLPLEEETVRIYERYSGRTITKVNVAMDSGVAMIRDVLNNDFFK